MEEAKGTSEPGARAGEQKPEGETQYLKPPVSEAVHDHKDPLWRPRGKDGKFLTENRGKLKRAPRKRNAVKKDDSVVEIKVVKEEPPKSEAQTYFEGVLGNYKERLATNFITSIIENRPSVVVIGGKRYFSEEKTREFCKGVTEALEKEAEERAKTSAQNEKWWNDSCDKYMEISEKVNEAEQCIVPILKKLRFWKTVSKFLILAIIGILIGFSLLQFENFISATDKPTTAETTAEAK